MRYSNYVQADLTNKLEQYFSFVIGSTINVHEETTNPVTFFIADFTSILVLYTPTILALIKSSKKC